jgi:hypothetical protein
MASGDCTSIPLTVADAATLVPTVLCPVIHGKGQRQHALMG